MNKVGRLERPYTAYGVYKSSAGEVEARNVQKRMNMTPQERAASFPPSTEDIPAGEQIVEIGYGPSMSLPTDEASRMGRAVAGGEEGINGFLYKGGQFLPQTQAPPGTWRIKVKGRGRNIANGAELVAPGERQGRPTPFSRSVMQMMGAGSVVDINPLSAGGDGVARLNPSYNWAYDGSSPDVKKPLKFKDLAQSKEGYSVNDLVDLYNKLYDIVGGKTVRSAVQ